MTLEEKQEYLYWKVRQLIKEKGITQDQLAAAINVSKQSLANYIGRNPKYYPPQDRLKEIADYFNVPLYQLDPSILETSVVLNAKVLMQQLIEAIIYLKIDVNIDYDNNTVSLILRNNLAELMQQWYLTDRNASNHYDRLAQLKSMNIFDRYFVLSDRIISWYSFFMNYFILAFDDAVDDTDEFETVDLVYEDDFIQISPTESYIRKTIDGYIEFLDKYPEFKEMYISKYGATDTNEFRLKAMIVNFMRKYEEDKIKRYIVLRERKGEELTDDEIQRECKKIRRKRVVENATNLYFCLQCLYRYFYEELKKGSTDFCIF